MFAPVIRVALEVPNFADSVNKGKSIRNAPLDARSNLANNKIDIKPSLLFRGSGITLTNN